MSCNEPKPPLNLKSRGDIEFRQQPDGVIEILDHEKSQRSWYGTTGLNDRNDPWM